MRNETAQRRKRVLELFGKPTRFIAEILLEEGFQIAGERQPRAKASREAWEAKRVDAMRRNVWNDREFWRERWRKSRSAPVTADDLRVASEEHIASLQTDLEEIHELIDENGTKSTAKAMLIGERRQTRALLAKARGVDELAKTRATDAEPTTTIVGVVLGTKNVTREMRQQLRDQGVEIDADEGDGSSESEGE